MASALSALQSDGVTANCRECTDCGDNSHDNSDYNTPS